HLLVEHQLGHEPLETPDLRFQFADAASVIGLGRIVLPPPVVVGVFTDAQLATHIGDRQALGQVAIHFPQQAYDLISAPSLSHKSLPGLSSGTIITTGPNFGEPTKLRPPSRFRVLMVVGPSLLLTLAANLQNLQLHQSSKTSSSHHSNG